jgi:dinuclear metal center YbgI/SA1388 family protein
MTRIKDITNYLESIAPRPLQESYDNAGLIVGDKEAEVVGVLIALDCTEEIIEEAIKKNANLVIAHHPIVFKGLKSLTGSNYIERTIIKAIKNDIAIYAIHTNLDNIRSGVNAKFGEKLKLQNMRILRPIRNLQKLVTYIPTKDTTAVLSALHAAGAGNIGDYSECSFTVTGTGHFTPGANTNPTIGNRNISETVEEDRVEVILPNYASAAIINTLQQAHPYEEVAYYLTDLQNINQDNGAGLIGELDSAMGAQEFLEYLKQSLNIEVFRHTDFRGKIKTVAICGGSGTFLLQDALQQSADAFITGDVKYHDFFDAENRILFCDVGHYESEVGTKELLGEILTKKFTTFALHLSEWNTNPIRYYK